MVFARWKSVLAKVRNYMISVILLLKKMSAEKMNAISKLKIYRLIFSPPTGGILPVVKIRACTGFDGGFEFGEASRKAMRQIPN